METSNDHFFVIADTSGLYSLLSETDSNHTQALNVARFLKQDRATILLPYDVFAETINIVGKRAGHAQAVAVSQVLQSPAYVLFDTAAAVRRSALDRFAIQPSSVSYTDCIVMAVADQYDTKDIFGFDEAFPRNGYHGIGELLLSS